MSISDRLVELKGGRSNAEFARHCGVQDSSIRQYIEGRSVPSLENLIKIADANAVSIEWLATGRVPKSSSGGQSEMTSVGFVAGFVSAGSGAATLDGEEAARVPSQLLRELGLSAGQTRLMTAKGDSMLPTIGDGDHLLIDLRASSPVDGRIYVLTVGGHLFVKRLRRSQSGWIMHSDNVDVFPPEPLQDPDAIVHGQVVWVGRRLGG